MGYEGQKGRLYNKHMVHSEYIRRVVKGELAEHKSCVFRVWPVEMGEVRGAAVGRWHAGLAGKEFFGQRRCWKIAQYVLDVLDSKQAEFAHVCNEGVKRGVEGWRGGVRNEAQGPDTPEGAPKQGRVQVMAAPCG